MNPYRWGLVAATLLGVLAMHGIGSHGVHGTEGDGVVMTSGHPGTHGAAATTIGEVASSDPRQGSGLGLEVLCVAILVGLAMSLRLLRRVRSTAVRLGDVRHAYAMVRPRARGPDPPSLVELSILRS